MQGDERLTEAFARFDAANSEDPNRQIVDGVDYPKELYYAQRMTHWLDKLEPNAPDAVKLAARSQHIKRWTSPRSSYPMDRTGYLRWRTDLKKFHAATAGEILSDVGYDAETIEHVQSMLRKEQLSSNPDTQLLEDVICLVFLESYFSDFSALHDEEKVISILQKTWKKMTERGHEAALKLQFTPEALALVQKALAG